MIRYCAHCDTESREADRCRDCGGPLEIVDDTATEAPSPHLEPPPGTYVPFLESSDFGRIDHLAARLLQSGVPYLANARGPGLVLRVRAEDVLAAERLVGRSRAFDPPKGTCPACGVAVPREALECPGCALILAPTAEPPTCRFCGGAILTADRICPDCGRTMLA